ncbi:MAG: ribonuclease Z [Candidatus Diapherotrites archaeon]|nr:ribonuclease Z [Candidatus Diapherotrites archaeon]
MNLSVYFLGTSCSNPTKERALTSTAIKYNGINMLFDCPEGTQRQMMMADLSYMKVKYVFLSHFHADHILGLPGLIATMSIHERALPLKIFGPKNVKKVINSILAAVRMRINVPLEFYEIKEGVILKEENFRITAFRLHHGIECYGFVLKENDKKGEFMREKVEKELGIPPGPIYAKLASGKTVIWKGKKIKPSDVLDYSKGRKGRKISIVMDTLASEDYIKFIEDSDLLVHEATFIEKHKSRAIETKHSTAKQAAEIAARANVKKLVLTHISPRYKDVKKLEIEARQEFANTIVAKDLMKITIPLRRNK